MAAAGQPQPVFVLLVTATVKEGLMDEFKAAFKPLAEYVTAHEDGALTYQLSTSGNNVCIYERYVSERYLEDVHWQSDAFKTFSAKVRELDLWASKTVARYWEPPVGEYGFVSR